MSGVLGVFDRRGRDLGDAALAGMIAALAELGAEHELARPAPGVALAAVRHDWERVDDLGGRTLLARSGSAWLAADASLYHRRALIERLALAGQPDAASDPGGLILAAWQAWRDRCAERLEGDYAFVLYDATSGQVLCARDFGGRRPLFWAELGGALVVASRVAAILAHPDCPRDLNLAVVGSAAANMPWACGSETAWRAVQVVPMAGTLRWDGRAALRRHWEPPPVGEVPAAPFPEAAEELREVLALAVSERLAENGPTAVWMSGGRDSTALFGAGRHALRHAARGRELLPVSISYPPGDSGREDELIQAVADFWGSSVRWIDIADVPMFARDVERAAERDEPATSPYENWNTALAEASRALGARVAFDGNGGDQLFGGSDAYLTDMLARGRWLALARELRARPGRLRRRILEGAVRPLVPAWLRRLAGAAPRHWLERALPAWIEPDFAAQHGLLERERAHLPAAGPGGLAAAELRWSLTIPVVGYMQGLLQRRFLAAGVLVRSPLLDRRVVELGLSRPASERAAGPESKRLLRAAMGGLLPDPVLARRPVRTGVTLSYSRGSMRRCLPALYDELLRTRLMLAELGVVEGVRLRRAVDDYRLNGTDSTRLDLFHTLQAELWLRGHGRSRRGD